MGLNSETRNGPHAKPGGLWPIARTYWPWTRARPQERPQAAAGSRLHQSAAPPPHCGSHIAGPSSSPSAEMGKGDREQGLTPAFWPISEMLPLHHNLAEPSLAGSKSLNPNFTQCSQKGKATAMAGMCSPSLRMRT